MTSATTEREDLAPQFDAIVQRIAIGPEMRDWLIQALKESHQEETAYHQETTQRLEDTAKTPYQSLRSGLSSISWMGRSQSVSGWKNPESGKRKRDEAWNHDPRAQWGVCTITTMMALRLLELASRAMNSMRSSRRSKKTNSYESSLFRTARCKTELCIRPTKNPSISWPGGSKEGIGVSDGFRTRDLRIHNPAL